MNRYPIWKYIIMAVALAIGLIYTLPNFFGETPAIQISSNRATFKLSSDTLSQVEQTLQQNHFQAKDITFNNNASNPSIRIRFSDTDQQLSAKDILQKILNPDPLHPNYIIALDLQSASPNWLTAIHALPMYLGLDLRGGIHFLLQVDMDSALNKKLDSDLSDARKLLRDKDLRDSGMKRDGTNLVISFDDTQSAQQALSLLNSRITELEWTSHKNALGNTELIGAFSEKMRQNVEELAVKQNITILHNRINELGVAEPIIQQQGNNRIVVELPGIQDIAKAKDIIGRTATLETRLADPDNLYPTPNSPIPPGDELFTQGRQVPVLLRKEVIFTGDQIIDASAGFDEQQRPAVNIRLNAAGGQAMSRASRENIGKPMGIVLFDNHQAEVLTVATIQTELSDRFQITGESSPQSAADLALLLRAGSLAAPMKIIEERTIGPSLGADNIKKGFDSVLYGFIAISVFMIAYYMFFGVVSIIGLSINLLLLVASLSILQATLTLPGIAAIALALGMAIDANVLINERIREELRHGAPAQSAIHYGYANAWATILDSNITTLIAGLALLAFGTGTIRGFAIVHCIGILTSMFSAVFFSRGIVNLWYGHRHKLQSLSVGQVWHPAGKVVNKAQDEKPNHQTKVTQGTKHVARRRNKNTPTDRT